MGIKFTSTSSSGYSNPVVSYRFIEAKDISATGIDTINLTNTYTIGTDEIEVFLNGQRMEINIDYTEETTNSIKFTYTLDVDDRVLILAREARL